MLGDKWLRRAHACWPRIPLSRACREAVSVLGADGSPSKAPPRATSALW
jgi:hypothetical protein